MAYGMLPGMEKTTVYLDPDIQRGLRAMSRARGRPQAELIREALARYLEQSAAPELPSWVGMWKHGPETDAATVKNEAREAWASDLDPESS
jgi:hypothetical protein